MTKVISPAACAPLPVRLLSSLVLLLCVLSSLEQVASLRDDWYGFASLWNTQEWSSTYKFTCSYNIDLFREPREISRRDQLQARRELHTPIRFRSKDTIRAPENLTLHIYNNIGVRRGYSVAYGFQTNKECLHGQDAECVVHPGFGTVRAVVLNAERFKAGENLNFIKDHFLIEKNEQFVTILNGGSIYERKFYEAIFLGGYGQDPKRSSHQIDGKTYPLEIYMFFLDETVPSVSLATILVVLVEETDRDNVQIKPITNAIESELYDAERRFLDRNKAMIRRERLFHHLGPSTHYNVYRDHPADNDNAETNAPILQEALDDSVHHEAIFTRYVEPFEKMQALEAELYFLLEDYERVLQLYDKSWERNIDILKREGKNYFFPTNNTEIQILALMSTHFGITTYKGQELPGDLSCRRVIYSDAFDEFYNTSEFTEVAHLAQLPPPGPHLDALKNVTATLCEHFYDYFAKINYQNKNSPLMRNVSYLEKYQLIYKFRNERLRRHGEMNKMIYDHFSDAGFHPPNVGEQPEYSSENERFELADRIIQVAILKERLDDYKRVKKEIENTIRDIAHRLEYKNEKEMEAVINYLKHGTKTNDLKYFRTRVYEDSNSKQLPQHKKKRTLIELGGMEISDKDISIYEHTDPTKAPVNQAFQISWLIPHDGGYYYYAGSSPIPPCFRADNVIVFKKPIKMTRRQIDVLTRVPTSFNREEDIRVTTPNVHDTRFEVDLSGDDTPQSRIEEVRVPVYHQPRSHLFLGHDGFHKNAVEEWEALKDRLAKAKNAADGLVKPGKEMMIIIIVGVSSLFYL